jgi:flagellar hook-basal body complex protein FliE
MSIAPIVPPSAAGIPEIELRGPIGVERTPAKPDVGGAFGKALEEAHAAEHKATESAEAFAKGDPGMGIHEVVIASEKANISIRYATTLKNKALEAYRELMNTQV